MTGYLNFFVGELPLSIPVPSMLLAVASGMFFYFSFVLLPVRPLNAPMEKEGRRASLTRRPLQVTTPAALLRWISYSHEFLRGCLVVYVMRLWTGR